MKKILFFAIAATAAFAFAAVPKCNYGAKVHNFEAVVEHAKWMKGAEEKKIPVDPEDPKQEAQIERKSKPVTSGTYTGLMLVDTYIFYGCNIKEVWMDKVDPQSLDTVSTSVAFLRENGKLRAICPDGKPVFKLHPFDGVTPNMDCECFDNNGMPKKKDPKYGCMTKSELLEKKRQYEDPSNYVMPK